MIGLWEQHKYGEKVNGITLRYPKFLAYADLARQWNFSEEDMAEVRRLENVQALGGELKDKQKQFLESMAARTDVYDLYALAFADGTDAKRARSIVAKDTDGTILKALARLCNAEMPGEIPARDHVVAALMLGHCVIPLAEQTIVQGLVLRSLTEEAINKKLEAIA